jgi:hypothetical protein
MTTRAEEGGTAGGSEKVERTGVLPTWVVVTGANPEYRAEALNPEIHPAMGSWTTTADFRGIQPGDR